MEGTIDGRDGGAIVFDILIETKEPKTDRIFFWLALGSFIFNDSLPACASALAR